jgi:hypothetical protein
MADQKAGPMGVEELDELERLEREATPGRWHTLEERGTPWDIEDERGLQVAQAQQQQSVRNDPTQASRHANAKLIAAMRNALPRLLALARSAITAEAAGREKGLEEAAQWVRLGRWHDPDSCAAGIRALTAQPPPALAQPSATRKEE